MLVLQKQPQFTPLNQQSIDFVGQTQQLASKMYNDRKGNSQTILPIAGIRTK
jgi:hypothetical protein